MCPCDVHLRRQRGGQLPQAPGAARYPGCQARRGGHDPARQQCARSPWAPSLPALRSARCKPHVHAIFLGGLYTPDSDGQTATAPCLPEKRTDRVQWAFVATGMRGHAMRTSLLVAMTFGSWVLGVGCSSRQENEAAGTARFEDASGVDQPAKTDAGKEADSLPGSLTSSTLARETAVLSQTEEADLATSLSAFAFDLWQELRRDPAATDNFVFSPTVRRHSVAGPHAKPDGRHEIPVCRIEAAQVQLHHRPLEPAPCPRHPRNTRCLHHER